MYALTCNEYDLLDSTAAGHCQMCGKEAPLVIDHDHALGLWAVRGAVCYGCNIRLGVIDAGKKAASPTSTRYLATPWHKAQGWRREDRARPKRRRPVRPLRAPQSAEALAASSVFSRGQPEKYRHERPDFLTDCRSCQCDHLGTVHGATGECFAATEWWDCPCRTFRPTASARSAPALS